MLVAGVDCSTQATKVLVVDTDDGTVVATGRADHEVTGANGARETQPEIWWAALSDALGRTGRVDEISAISVAGQQHGLVVLDDAGRPLRAAMLWNDTRSAVDALELVEAFGGARAWAERIGSVPVASYTVSKWAWLRRTEPAVAAATKAVRLPHDYLNGCLTGRGCTDRGEASGTGWWSTQDEGYASDVLALAQVRLEADLLPVVLGPTGAPGEVTREASRQTGLRAGTLVGPGTGDNMAAALGLGLEPGMPVISLGTSGTAYVLSTVRASDDTGTVAGFADATGRFLPLAATLNCTQAVDKVAAWLGLAREGVADRTKVVVLPYLDGERTPNLPRAAGAIIGLRHATTGEEILLAAYQGAALGLIDALAQVADHSSGIDPRQPLVLIGGGARGRAWRRVVAEMSGMALQIPESKELAAIGAAAQATSALTGEAAHRVALRWETRRGSRIESVGQDLETVDRIRSVRQLLTAGFS